MNPRRLDWRAVESRLVRIGELLDTLHERGEIDGQRLGDDELLALAVERILTLVVDLAFSVNSHVAVAELGRAPDSYAASFPMAADAGLITSELAVALRPSAGTRNVLVHGYLEIDHAQVAAAVPLALRDYREYVRQAARWMRDRAG